MWRLDGEEVAGRVLGEGLSGQDSVGRSGGGGSDDAPTHVEDVAVLGVWLKISL